MKKLLFLLTLLTLGQVLGAQELTPSQEKQLLDYFLQAVYAGREGNSQATDYLEKALALAPDSKYLKKTLLLQTLAENKLELADKYADFTEMGENDAEDWSAYAAYLWKRGRLKEAAEAYQKAIALDPENFQPLYAYLTLLSVYSPDQAIRLLEDIAQQYPQLASAAYTEAGKLFLRWHEFSKALAYFDKSLQLDPEEINARLGKAEVYERNSQFFLMLHELEELEKLGFGNAYTYSRMASVFLLGKDTKKARQYFLKAKADQNEDVPAAYFLAVLAEQEGDFEAAIRYLRDAADFEKDASKWLQVSFYQQKLNQLAQSADTLEQAYQKFPDNVEIAFFYGLALEQIRDYKKAANVYSALVAAHPEYTRAWLQYAYTLESLKKYKKREEAIRQVLALEPANAAALNLWAYSLAQRGIRLEEAQEYIARALAVEPQDYAFQDTLF